MKSNTKTVPTPMASTQRVSIALLGTTRSYTFMMNKGVTRANRLMSNAAKATDAYIGQNLRSVPQNHALDWRTPTSRARLSRLTCGRANKA